jgi:two-component system LytT family sensor kinase
MFWRLHLVGWIVYGAGTYFATLARITPDQFIPMLGLKVVRTALGFGLSFLLHIILNRLRRRAASWGILALVSVPVCLALGAGWLVLYWSSTDAWRVAELPAIDWSTFPRAALDHAFVLLTWAAADIGFHEWRARETAERRMQAAASELRDAELNLLRYQLNPHFLFNALTTLRASIPLEATSARDTVDALSGFLRHALRASPIRMVPLAQEIEATTNFLAIQRLRYGPRLEARVDLDPCIAHVEVPGFLLQPLVENAVTHGMTSDAVPLLVAITARQAGDGLRIEVTNSTGARMNDRQTSIPRSQPVNGHRIGLSNVQERLRRHYGDRATFALEHRAHEVTASIQIAVRPN